VPISFKKNCSNNMKRLVTMHEERHGRIKYLLLGSDKKSYHQPWKNANLSLKIGT